MFKTIQPNSKPICSEKKLSQCINIRHIHTFFKRNIFAERYKYCVCVDYLSFEMHIYPGLKRFLRQMGEESFILALFPNGKLKYCIEYNLADKKNDDKTLRGPDYIYSNLTTYVDHLEFIYYTQKCDWLAWFSSACEFGIFAFEDDYLIEKFIKEMDRRDLFILC